MPRYIATAAMALWFAVSPGASGTHVQTAVATANAQSTREIDTDVWSVFVATVATDDIVRMGSVYFPDAVPKWNAS